MARRATLRAVLALALVAVLVSAQDASCETQGSCDAGLASPDVSTVAPAIEATTVEATPETAKAPEPESDSQTLLDPPPDAMPPVESATPPPLEDGVDAVADPVEVEDHAAIASALRLELERARAEIERLERRVALDERLTETDATARTTNSEATGANDAPDDTAVEPESDTRAFPSSGGTSATCETLETWENAWFPPWVHKRAARGLAEANGVRRAATALTRAILDGFGVLERVDAFVAKVTSVVRPYFDRARLAYDAFAAKTKRAKENVEKLVREFRKSSARRRERKLAELAAERQRRIENGEPVEPERLNRFSESYWKRQGQRANALFGDLRVVIGGAYGAAKARSIASSRDAFESFTKTKGLIKTRVVPAWARVRVAVSKKATSVAELLLAKFPGKTERALASVAKALRSVGFVGYEDLETTLRDARDFGMVLGDFFLASVFVCGVLPFLYFVVFRVRPGDALPNEAEYKIKHVPANDGTFLGGHVGGGVDVVVRLPEVRRAAQCDILVGEDEVKVNALEGYHDVTVSIPPEAKGSEWIQGSDVWVMRAKFELKTETLTVSLRTPAAATARGAASPLGDEKENAKKGNANDKNGGATGGASTVRHAARTSDAPFSPVTPNRSVAADKAAAAVKAAASARKKRVT